MNSSRKTTKREVQIELVNSIGSTCYEQTFSNLIFLYSEFNDDKLLRKVIYDKSFRPDSLSEQKQLLYKLSTSELIPLNHRVNAAIASSHKAMESLDLNFCKTMSVYLREFGDLASIGSSTNIREDRTHIFFSRLAVLFHLGIVIDEFDLVFQDSMTALETFEKLAEANFSSAFYQTCTNVVRCLVICYLFGVFSKDKDIMARSAQAIKKCFYFGILNSDSHEVKFKEYLEATSTWTFLSENHGLFSSFLCDEKYRHRLTKLFLKALRPHSPEKVELMRLNFTNYMRKNFA